MKRRRVHMSDRAKADLRQLHRYIAIRGAPRNATAYVKRIVAFAKSLDLAAERGMPMPIAGVNIRAIPFESVMIAALVDDNLVTVVRVYHASQDWLKDLFGVPSPPTDD